jgi:hypothetical protein
MNTARPHPSFFDSVSLYFDWAALFTEQPKGLLDQIKVCNSVYSFQFPCAPGEATKYFRLARPAQPPQASSERWNQVFGGCDRG